MPQPISGTMNQVASRHRPSLHSLTILRISASITFTGSVWSTVIIPLHSRISSCKAHLARLHLLEQEISVGLETRERAKREMKSFYKKHTG
jgi:hypothetical protein